MLKKALIAVSAIAILLMVAVSYLTARFVDRKEIQRVQEEAARLRITRDSIQAAVRVRDSLEREFEGIVTRFQDQGDRLRTQVAEAERDRAAAQLTVRQLRRKEDLQGRLRRTYPEMAASDWGVTEVFNEQEHVSIEYLLIPLWFSETFIIEHQNAESWRAQRDKLLLVDSLQRQVTVLQDSIVNLEHANRLAFQQGLDSTLAKYEDLNREYISLLEKPPQVKFGLPSWGSILVSAAAGVVLGTQIK